MFRYIGKTVAVAIRMILGFSSMPNQVMNSGTRAMNGIVRSICSGASKISSPIFHRPAKTPSTSPIVAPMSRPMPARSSEMGSAACREPSDHSSW